MLEERNTKLEIQELLDPSVEVSDASLQKIENEDDYSGLAFGFTKKPALFYRFVPISSSVMILKKARSREINRYVRGCWFES